MHLQNYQCYSQPRCVYPHAFHQLGLSDLERALLMLACAPTLTPVLGRVFQFLQENEKSPTVGLLAELATVGTSIPLEDALTALAPGPHC